MKRILPNCLSWFAAAACLWMFGCATMQNREFAMTAKAPNVRIGPVHQLLKVKTAGHKVRVVLDRSGQGHVIVAKTKRKEVLHIVVGPDGVLEREVIRSSISPRAIDAAFDAAGHLHVLIDAEHLVKKDGIWHRLERTPWQEAGYKAPEAPRFAPGAADLIWAFTVGGKKVGAPDRWDWYGFGGYGFAIVWPERTTGSKLVVVRETDSNYTSWAVLDPQDALDVVNWQLAVDAEGTVHVVYDACRILFTEEAHSRYAQFRFEDRPSETMAEESYTSGPKKGKFLLPVTGQAISLSELYDVGNQASIAADPLTGTVLLLKARTASWLLSGREQSERIRLPLRLFWWDPRLAPAGNNRFHAVVIGGAYNESKGKGVGVNYLAFANGAWSAPVELGKAHDPFSGWPGDAIQLGSNGRREALVVWPIKEAIVARWVVLLE